MLSGWDPQFGEKFQQPGFWIDHIILYGICEVIGLVDLLVDCCSLWILRIQKNMSIKE